MHFNAPSEGAVTAPGTTPVPGTYVVYRDVDRLLKGDPEHTRICRVLDDGGYAPKGQILLFEPSTNDVIRYASTEFVRTVRPDEFMIDIDTAPLKLSSPEGRFLGAAAAWIVTQRGEITGGGRPTELPPAGS